MGPGTSLPIAAILVALCAIPAPASDPDELSKLDTDLSDEAFVVTPAQEAVLGQRTLEMFLAERKMSEDPAHFLRVDSIGRKVARVSDRPELTYRFFVVQGKELQAYSFPGGTVCFTDALVELYRNDDELAFALAHEIVHVVHRHHIAEMQAARIVESGKPEEETLLLAVKNKLGVDAEMDADRYGALYAVRAGYRYTASYESVERLARRSRGPRKDATHPDYRQRTEELREFRSELGRVLEAFDRGVAALRDNDPREAISMLDIFVAEFPNSVAGRVNLGAAYLAKVRKNAGAPEGLAELLPILPDSGIVIRNVIDTMDLQQARANFEQVVRANPDDAIAHAGLALVHLRLGEYADARGSLNQAITLQPNNHDLLLCRGNVEYVTEHFDEAAAFYHKALAMRADSPEARKNLAMAYERLDRLAEACEIWTTLTDHPRIGDTARERVDEDCMEMR